VTRSDFCVRGDLSAAILHVLRLSASDIQSQQSNPLSGPIRINFLGSMPEDEERSYLVETAAQTSATTPPSQQKSQRSETDNSNEQSKLIDRYVTYWLHSKLGLISQLFQTVSNWEFL